MTSVTNPGFYNYFFPKNPRANAQDSTRHDKGRQGTPWIRELSPRETNKVGERLSHQKPKVKGFLLFGKTPFVKIIFLISFEALVERDMHTDQERVFFKKHQIFQMDKSIK